MPQPEYLRTTEPKKARVNCSQCNKVTYSNASNPLCKNCVKTFEKLREQSEAEAKERQKRTEFLSSSLDVMRQALSVNQQSVDVVDQIIEHFGGARGFATAWMTDFSIAREEKPGSALVLRTFRELAQHMREVGRISEQQLAEIDDLDLKEVEEEMHDILKVYSEPA